MMKLINYYNLLNLIYKYDIKSCTNLITNSLKNSEKIILTCINPHSFYLLNNDLNFYNSVIKSNLLIPDGIGILYASKLLNLNIKEKITGPDLFYSLMNELNKKNDIKVYFLGSNSDTLKKINAKFSQDFKNIKLVGQYSPPYRDTFTDDENLNIINAINKVSPDILWIGMTQPKQEKWIFENKDKLNIKFAAGIGAQFDYYSGNITMPNKIYLSFNLQWLHRLIQNPRKMWKRNFISSPIFCLNILTIKFFNLYKEFKKN
jgi:N-acetylglucosaminyldiphosphoundecaprenol N-acetyl-beta-D-mannosaminyltransferase